MIMRFLTKEWDQSEQSRISILDIRSVSDTVRKELMLQILDIIRKYY